MPLFYAQNYCQNRAFVENGKWMFAFSGPCIVTGKTVEVKVPAEALKRYAEGAHIQDAFSMLNEDDREFLMSGHSKEGWDLSFGKEEE